MPPNADISCRFLGPLRRTAAGAGATLHTSALVGLDQPWLPAAGYAAALTELSAGTEVLGFARQVGRAVRPADLGLWHYLVMASETVGDGLARAERFLPLLFRGLHMGVRGADPMPGGEALLALGGPWPEPLVELWLSAWLGPLQQTGKPGPRAIWLTRPRHPDEPTTWPGAAGPVPVRFSAPLAGLRFLGEDLQAPQPAADRDVIALLEPDARARMARAEPPPTSWSERVAQAVADDLSHGLARGTPDLSRVARTLGVSRATLTRRLADEGERFRAISDRVRAATAKRQLREGCLSISEIAFGLGFANPAAFHRAFKRWTAQNPGAFRRLSE